MRKNIITIVAGAALVVGITTACDPAELETAGAGVSSGVEVVEQAEVEQPEDIMTASQRNAVRKAEQYIDYSAFSRSGLIQQLEFEGFATADAAFAVDEIEVDWTEQAHKKAEQYMSYSAFSQSGLVQQLEFEGFTAEQARAGAASQF